MKSQFHNHSFSIRFADPPASAPLLATIGLLLAGGAAFADDVLSWDLPVSTGAASSGILPTGPAGFSGTAMTSQSGTASATAETRYWTRTGFDAADFTAAQAAGDFISFQTSAATGFKATISGIGPSNMRLGTKGPSTIGLFHSSDNVSFAQVGTSATLNGSTDTDIGAAFGSTLAAAPIVINSGETHFWRIVAFGAGAVSDAGRIRWVSDSAVDFKFTGAVVPAFPFHDLAWSGAGGSNWNTDAANKNWLDGGSPAAFSAGDYVTIGGPASIAVDSGGVAPGGVSVVNATGSVVLAGGKITGYFLTKTGAGTLEIGGAHSFGAGVSLKEGTTKIATSAALGSLPVVLNGGTLAPAAGLATVSGDFVLGATPSAIDAAANVKFTGVFSTTGAAFNTANALTKTGPGVLTISNTGTSAFGGQSTINSAGLMIDFDVAAGGAVFTGGGTRNLGGDCVWNAPVTLAGGVIQLHGGSIGGSGAISLTADSTIRSRLNFGVATVSAPIAVPAGVAFKADSANGDNQLLLTGGISGDGALDKIGNGEVRLAAANSHTGGTLVEAGKLSIKNVAALGPNPAIVSGGQLVVEQLAGTIANDLTLTGTTAGIGDTGKGALVFHNDGQESTLDGAVTLAGDTAIRSYSSGCQASFEKPIAGTGNLTLEAGGAASNHNQRWRLKGSASTFAGNVSLRSDGSANAILILDGGSLPPASVLTMADSSTVAGNNAVLDLNGHSQTLAGLNRTAGANGLGSFITNGGAGSSTLTIDGAGDSDFSGVIGANTAAAATGQTAGGNAISLVKSGGGKLTLGGANTYSGSTSVLGGRLAIASSNLSDTSTITIGGGGVLELGGGTDVVGALVIDGVSQAGGGAIYNSANTGGAIVGGSLQVGQAGGGGYASWISGAPHNLNGSDALPGADPDRDGIPNAVEFVIGGNPASGSDLGKLPSGDASGANLLFTFRLSDLAAYLNPTVEYGSDLAGWTSAVDGIGGVAIGAPSDLGGGVKQIVVTIPKDSGTKRFARLRVAVP